MSDSDLNISESRLNNTIEALDNDISVINDILVKTVEGYKKLDEEKWVGPEKKKIDEEFLPYLEKISVKYPELLTSRSTFLKKARDTYKATDQQIKQAASDELIE